MVKNKNKQRGEKKGSGENYKKESKEENKEDVILMGAPKREAKETPPKEEITVKTSTPYKKESKSVRIDFGDDVEHTTASEEELSKITTKKKSTPAKKEHVSLGKIFLGLIAIFVAYLIVGQILDMFGPTTVSLLALWPLLLILVGLSLFKVRKKKTTSLLAVLVVVVIFVASVVLVFKGGDIVTIHTTDTVVTEERGVDPFSGINFDGVGTLKVTEGDRETIIISADEAVIGEVATNVENDTLYIKYDNSLWSLFLFEDTSIAVEVISRDVSKIAISGKATVEVSNIKGEILDFGINGTGEAVIADVDLDELIVRINGAGDITTSGSAERELILFSGTGSYDGSLLLSNETGVRISGAGDVRVNTKDELNVSINGAGNVIYTGEPKLTGGNINGTGSIMSKAASEAKAVEDSEAEDAETSPEEMIEEPEEEAIAEEAAEDVVEEITEEEDASAVVDDPESFLKTLDSVFE